MNNQNSGNAYDLGDISNIYDINNKIKAEKISGVKKCAVLLIALGNDVSSNVIKNLPKNQIKKIGVEIANLHTVSSEQKKEILEEFLSMSKHQDFILEGGIEFAETLLQGALGDKEADRLIEGIKYDAHNKVFMSARNTDVNKLINCLKGERAQTIAVVLDNIQPEKSAQILGSLEPKIQQEVVLKLGNMSDIDQEVIKMVDRVLEKKLEKYSEVEKTNGVDNLSEILSNVDRKTEKSIMSYLEENDKVLAKQIKDNMFVFDDIAQLDNASVQKILKEVNVKDIAYALKGSDDNVSEVIYKNQSQRASSALKEEIEMLGSVKLSQVEEAQQTIVSIIRRLGSDGIIDIKKGDEEELVL